MKTVNGAANVAVSFAFLFVFALVAGVFAAGVFSSVAIAGTATDEDLRGSEFREAVRGSSGVIATESPAASEVGLSVLDGGGNAVDAAVAAVFAVNVARPQSCGVGGGGFMVYRGADGETASLDFRETAPEAMTADTFEGDGIFNAFTGHTTVGVPGVVAGMDAALQRYGTMSLAQTISPAESLARNGVEIQPVVADEIANNEGRLALFPTSAGQFLDESGEPYEAGDILVQPDLADTFSLLARDGADAFYRGEISESIVADMENAGDYPGDEGLMTLEDLAAYEAKWREPLVGEYRGAEVVAMGPPTSGGVALIEMLNILEGFELSEPASADTLHLIAEAQKIAFADREEYLADADFVDVLVSELTSKAYADERRGDVSPDEAGEYEPGSFGGEAESGEDTNPDTNTTHLSVVDAEGNAVSLTCTIEQSFGSAVVAPGTGFLLNNEMTDFSEAGTANEPEGGKRPRSSINPAILVEDGEPTLVVGGAGGVQIVMGSLLPIVNTVDFDMSLAEAIDAPRLDALAPPDILLEDGRISAAEQADLISRGHTISREGEYADLPRVQAVGVDASTGERLAATDPRSGEEEYAALAQVGAPQSGMAAEVPDTGGTSGYVPLLLGLFACVVGAALLLVHRRMSAG